MINRSFKQETRIIVFTDLDATLLHQHSYDWTPAISALEIVESKGAELVLASSKTFSELGYFAERLCTQTPFIGENGGVIAIPNCHPLSSHTPEAPNLDDYSILTNGLSRERLLQAIATLRSEFGFRLQGFADWSAYELGKLTGLSVTQAQKALRRQASEPILWQDTPKQLVLFEREVELRGMKVIRGGQFLHVMGQTDKADAMNQLLEYYEASFPQAKFTSIALGDSENDVGMITQADIGVVIPNPKRCEPLVLEGRNIIYAPQAGPSGWNAVVSELFESL
ncbi:MAG: HAD-IIB family hydrolase [Planctomycetaceae bacterium]